MHLRRNIMNDAMFDNTGEIDYILKKLLPEAKLNKDKNGYNKLLAKAQSEAKIIVNDKCEPIDIVLREQRTGEKLIEISSSSSSDEVPPIT